MNPHFGLRAHRRTPSSHFRPVLLAALISSLGSGALSAQSVSGTVRGQIRIADGRADPYLGSGFGLSSRSSPPPDGARQVQKFTNPSLNPVTPLVPAPRILVEVCVGINGGNCTLRYRARASETGMYSVPWSATGSVTSIRVGAYPEWPDITTVWTAPTHPPNVFRVTTAGSPIIHLGWSQLFTTGVLTGVKEINVDYGQSEYGDAYLTSAEVTLMHAAQNQPPRGSIVNDLKGVLVSVLEPIGTPAPSGVTPRDDLFRLAPSTAQLAPFVVAHEWGHIVTWRSFDVEFALIVLQYYSFDGDLVWSDLSNEWERAAWMDGIAHMHAAMWMWTRSAADAQIPRGTPRSMEVHDSPNECGNGIMGHRRVMCNARAMWDIVDRPTGDDDTLTSRDLGSVIEVMRSYARTCVVPFTNGCVGEEGYDEMNWMDYRRNHINRYGDQVYLDIIGGLNDLLSSNNL